MVTESSELKAAKLTRRNAKAALTRSGRVLTDRIENNRSANQIKETLSNVEKVYNDLVKKHEKYTEFIEDDAAFEMEEKWLEDCQQQFLSLEARAKGYLEEINKANSPKLKVNEENNTDVALSEQTEESNSEKEIVILKAPQEARRKWNHRQQAKIPSLRMTVRKSVRFGRKERRVENKNVRSSD